jgi:hypothetical protein
VTNLAEETGSTAVERVCRRLGLHNINDVSEDIGGVILDALQLRVAQ